MSIADDGRNDWMERNGEKDAGWVANGEAIQRSKLRADVRKVCVRSGTRIASPKRYRSRHERAVVIWNGSVIRERHGRRALLVNLGGAPGGRAS